MRIRPCFLVAQCLWFFMLIGCASVQGDWEKATKSDTVYAYKAFLGDHPNSEYDAQGRKRIEEIEWAYALKEGNAYTYRTFVKKYPKSPHAKEAEEKITDLEWADAKKRDSVESYANFLSKYPSNLHAGEAGKRIRELKFEAARKAESVAAIEDFLKVYPQGDDAEALRRELPTVRLWEPRKRLAERVIRLCPKDTLTVKNLLEGTTRTPPSNYTGDLAEIRSLLDRGVDPNGVRIAGWAPRREEQGVVFLRGGPVISREIKMGDPGRPVPPDKAGMTLLEYCNVNGLTEVYDLLKSHGAK